MNSRVHIAGVPFDPVSYESALNFVGQFMESSGQAYLVTPNPEMVVHAKKDPIFRGVLERAALSIPDGIGIVWAGHYLKEKATLLGSLARIFLKPASVRTVFPDRVTGTDLLEKIVERAQEKQWTMYFLGARSGIAEIAQERLLKKYPQAQFVGAYAGSPAFEEEEKQIAQINQAAPQILFVAYGSPMQEEWISRNLSRMPSVKVAMGVGGAFDFHAGKTRRAPKVMQKLGVEWLWRVLRQPSRLKRIYRATAVFIALVSKEKKV
jgi:N-acetylglucosaminyldiphosphoundecaprenol N-acetyl-beta-D-mannosaminyltransferase